jgi:hypothetical protein
MGRKVETERDIRPDSQESYERKNAYLSDYSLFRPISVRGLLNDYPELNDVTEFKKLSKVELLFTWYFANEASPFYDQDDEFERAKNSLKYALYVAQDNSVTRAIRQQYATLEFPEKVASAILKMKTYKLGPRVRAKKMVDNILNNFEKIIKMDIDSEEFKKDGEKDFDKIKKYVDSATNIAKNIPDLISMSESGFAVAKRGEEMSDSEVDGGGSLIDQWHEEN